MTTRTAFLVISFTLIISTSQLLALAPGQTIALKVTDLDGRTLSAADGQTTILILTTRSDVDKARLVGDRTPDFCLGNPKFRMVTVIQFPKTTSRTIRFLFMATVRQRVNTEAKRLKVRYLKKKLTADPRQDIHVAADFDGQMASQLGLPGAVTTFRVLILGANGVLLREWTDVPSSQELDNALR